MSEFINNSIGHHNMIYVACDNLYDKILLLVVNRWIIKISIIIEWSIAWISKGVSTIMSISGDVVLLLERLFPCIKVNLRLISQNVFRCILLQQLLYQVPTLRLNVKIGRGFHIIFIDFFFQREKEYKGENLFRRNKKKKKKLNLL